MSDESPTASIAREMISEANDTPASEAISTADHNQTLADLAPDAALRELYHLTGGETDRTRLEAAAAVQRTDQRPVVMTAQGMLRRHDPDESPTHRAAREMMDLHAYGAARGIEIDPEDRRARAVEAFARDLFRAEGLEAPPAIRGRQLKPEAVDAIVDLIIKRGRGEIE
jgi:hypothetical protein